MSTTTASAAMRTGASTFTGRYVLVDGTTVVAARGAALLSGTLLAPINHDERNVLQSGKLPWTGTMTDGKVAVGANCNDWVGSSDGTGVKAVRGSTDEPSGAWSQSTKTTCSGDGPIYCFEVP